MAKKLEVCAKQFNKLKSDLVDHYHAIEKAGMAEGVCESIIKQAASSIGERVQILKDKGDKGTKLADFLADDTVKSTLKSIAGAIARYDGQLKEMLKAKPEAAKCHAAFDALKADLTAEVQQRKTKKVAFFKIESKSLPDLEKLVDAMDAYERTAPYSDTEPDEFQRNDSAAEFHERANTMITDEISKTRAQSQADDTDMLKQGLDLRVIKGTTNKVKIGHDAIMEQARLLIEARKAGDSKGAAAALKKAQDAFKEIDPLAKKVKTASESPTIKAKLKSKDGIEVTKYLTVIEKLHSDAAGVLKKLG